MTRRQLFAALASLPFVGRLVRKPGPTTSSWEISGPLHSFTLYYDGERSWATVDGEVREVPFGTTQANSSDGRRWTFSNGGQGSSAVVLPGFDIAGTRQL